MTVVVAAAVVREGPGRPVLLTKRLDEGHLANMWEFPGGKSEPGEDPRDAVVRECREEIAVELEVVDVLDVAFHRYPKKDVLLVFYDCRLVSGEIQHIEVADHAWVEPADLAQYELPPPDARLLEKLASGR